MVRVGINGFGRIGRLSLRAALSGNDIAFVRINEPAADPETLAHLLNFDSVHGRCPEEAHADQHALRVAGHRLHCSRDTTISACDWSGCDIVIHASGIMNTTAALRAYLDQGVKRVLVTAPVKEPEVLNVVMGVNHQRYDPQQHRIITAASCTTNCLAPIVQVIHHALGIVHGSITTIHDVTNTQTILDAPHQDLRRARACGMSLIPTSTGSATAITHIFPELAGKLNGYAVRVPLANASLTDCVFEVAQPTTATAVNQLLADAAAGELQGILGYETRPLVSIDYKTDPRSAVIDALSTMVIDDTQLKIYAWYDNEWGYANRTIDLLRLIARHETD